MASDLTSFDADNEAMAIELVEKIDRVIRLAESDAFIPAGEHQSIIDEGRKALAEVAAFFEVDLPEAGI